MSRFDVVGSSIDLVNSFRSLCLSHSHAEQRRKPIVSRHDPTIRFTNSTISVLKPLLIKGTVETRSFLSQPALRLHNLDSYRQCRSDPRLGSYFIALGTLVPPGDGHDAAALARSFLVSGAKIEEARLTVRHSSRDRDMAELSERIGLRVELDGCKQEDYRHRFGIRGLLGRNLNFAIEVAGIPQDVGNLIAVEQDGEPRGIELAFGANLILAYRDNLGHPVDATPGALGREFGFESTKGLDVLGTCVALALDGLRPTARGRGGRFRELLRLLRKEAPTPAACEEAIAATAAAEIMVRSSISPLDDGHRDLASAECRELLRDGLARIAP